MEQEMEIQETVGNVINKNVKLHNDKTKSSSQHQVWRYGGATVRTSTFFRYCAFVPA
jgi:hypothetical protein